MRAQDGAGDHYFFYALDGRLLGEYDNTGTWKKEYVYLGAKLLAQVENVVAVAPGVPGGGGYLGSE